MILTIAGSTYTMFVELNAHLVCSAGSTSADRHTAPKGDFFLVTEADDVDASFLVHHFLSWYLKGGCSVVFLALSQSFSHYSAVAQKLSVNLTGARASGQLVFVSGLQFSFPLLRGHSQDADSDENLLRECIKSNSLQPLYAVLKNGLLKVAGAQSSVSNTLFLIDDIGILQSVGIDSRQVTDLIQYCQSLLLHQNDESNGSLVALLHCDSGRYEDEEIAHLSNRLQHACTCHLRVEGLSSGFCKDVHGQMTIIHKSANCDRSRPSRKTLQFKILDKNISFFAAGTSSAVL